MRGFGGVVGVLLFFLVVVGGAGAATADPNPLAFGDVPINTALTRTVTVTLDTGYHVIGATGAGINTPYSLDFDTCATAVGPTTCTIKETFAPTTVGPAPAGTLGLFVCPTTSGSCLPNLSITLSGNGTQIATSTTLTSSANPSRLGDPVTFTATVTPASGTGTVTFSEGATTLGSVPLNGGTASVTTTALVAGSHTITATYGGDATHTGSSTTLTQVIRLASTSTTLVSSANPSLTGHA